MPASPKFKTIITDYGKQRLVAAMSPDGTRLTLTQMAVGDGGGNPTNPDTTNTTLINEVWRAAVNSVSVDKTYSNIIIVELLIPAEVGGFWIREAGIYDEFNRLVAICSLPASEKPLLEQGSGRAQTVRMTLVISDLSTINITIDSTTIIATNDYVDNSLKEHEKSRNHPDATLTDKGFVKLYSGVTSMDETMAATPKAVKIAMDNASARLAKERNLADLPNIPLALSNLTLADVKKAVEQTHLGLSKLPQFRPATEDDLTSLPAGYMALSKNATPGGPLPDENWHYLEVAGNIDNPSNNPRRKGAVIRLTQVSNPGISWTGAKFDDGSTTTAKFTWARDFNSLNKPTPEDVGLAATKKAINDTQTGLAVQGVMWISTADDLSNLPAGAHRFARNNTGVTVLPSDGYFFLEVLAKRDTANGSCILATSDTRDVWIGFRYTVPDEANFTWIQLNQTVENLGLTEAVKRALNAVQKNGDEMTGNLYLKNDGRVNFCIMNEDGTPRMWLFKDKGGDGIHINNGNDGGGDYVFHKDGSFYAPLAVRAGGSKKLAVRSDNNSELSAHFNLWGAANRPTVIELDDDQGWHLYSQRNPDGSILFTVNGDIMANRKLNVGDATFSSDGNINGSVWGGWLNDWLNNNLSRKNTASLETNGWFKDASTGLIIQWGITGGNLNKAVVNLPIPFPNAGLWSLGWVAGTLDMGNDDWSNSASLLNNSQLTVTTDHWWSTAWIAIGK
ncbi:phage tail protein [Salmonella enterica]|nr:phage tail protein [Salmonella enterica]